MNILNECGIQVFKFIQCYIVPLLSFNPGNIKVTFDDADNDYYGRMLRTANLLHWKTTEQASVVQDHISFQVTLK